MKRLLFCMIFVALAVSLCACGNNGDTPDENEPNTPGGVSADDSSRKIIELLTKANPNTVEQLGCRPEQSLYLSEIGKELLTNRKMFLSKLCIHSFGNYGQAQLRRLENKSARLTSQAEYERHILNSIENAFFTFRERYLT